jgi:hypothetical protein
MREHASRIPKFPFTCNDHSPHNQFSSRSGAYDSCPWGDTTRTRIPHSILYSEATLASHGGPCFIFKVWLRSRMLLIISEMEDCFPDGLGSMQAPTWKVSDKGTREKLPEQSTSIISCCLGRSRSSHRLQMETCCRRWGLHTTVFLLSVSSTRPDAVILVDQTVTCLSRRFSCSKTLSQGY